MAKLKDSLIVADEIKQKQLPDIDIETIIDCLMDGITAFRLIAKTSKTEDRHYFEDKAEKLFQVAAYLRSLD
jgi:hypothetical protein